MREEGHNHLGGVSQIVGKSMIVGINTLSILTKIEEGSGFEDGRPRKPGRLQQVELGPRLLRMLRMRGVE